ncbi:hypothetical protein HBA55_22175 [Pseudomaricurvus alkylphenolicus]|uniref:hypothetical protein n=1 Tax=Pseudomaricurvus alkylphenolicus TaxID=1306991 RepID=UPI00141FA33A|nr:hypothetical protein [Pseudomaricurvus alkylphenolicus]NIB42331.1 hypothetical protein [Pseudomaricurvus alkylphenolicus]
MNLKKLKQAEAIFLAQFPEGFSDPGLDSVRKKHNVGNLTKYAKENLNREQFNQPQRVCDDIVKVITRSSMVSVFEKVKFRDFVKLLNSHDKEFLAQAFEKRLYGRQKRAGFEEIQAMLAPHKVAKWPILSAVPYYLTPNKEAFLKPTTAKKIIQYLELDHLQYTATPTWEFYRGYKKALDDVKKNVHPSISSNYAALSGFLMMSM